MAESAGWLSPTARSAPRRSLGQPTRLPCGLARPLTGPQGAHHVGRASSEGGLVAPGARRPQPCAAAQIVSGKGHGKAVDWWSVGILLYEMLCGTPPFRARGRAQLQRQILTARLKLPRARPRPPRRARPARRCCFAACGLWPPCPTACRCLEAPGAACLLVRATVSAYFASEPTGAPTSCARGVSACHRDCGVLEALLTRARARARSLPEQRRAEPAARAAGARARQAAGRGPAGLRGRHGAPLLPAHLLGAPAAPRGASGPPCPKYPCPISVPRCTLPCGTRCSASRARCDGGRRARVRQLVRRSRAQRCARMRACFGWLASGPALSADGMMQGVFSNACSWCKRR